MLALTEKIKCRGLSEQPNFIQVATRSCDIKHIIEIIWINVKHSIYNLDKCEPHRKHRLWVITCKGMSKNIKTIFFL